MNEPATWTQAEDSCKSMNAHLASVMDPIEQAYVFTRSEQDAAWIGLNNKQVHMQGEHDSL